MRSVPTVVPRPFPLGGPQRNLIIKHESANIFAANISFVWCNPNSSREILACEMLVRYCLLKACVVQPVTNSKPMNANKAARCSN